MFNFSLKKAAIYQALGLAKNPVFRFGRFKKKLFLCLFFTFLFLFLLVFLPNVSPQKNQSRLLGFAVLSLVLFFISWYQELFLSRLKNPCLRLEGSGSQAKLLEDAALNPEKYNLAEFLSFETAEAVLKSIEFSRKKKLSEISSTVLLYFLLEGNQKFNFIFSRALLNRKEIKKLLKGYLERVVPSNEKATEINYQKDFQEAIIESLKISQKKEHSRAEAGDIVAALSKHDLIFKKILIDFNLKEEDINNLTWWLEDLEEKIKGKEKFWEWNNLIKRGSLAKQWTAGYTLTLDKFSIDISEFVKRQGFPEIIGHQKEISSMERILSRREINNVLVAGEAGSGRKSMVYALAKRSYLGESLPEINFKRVVQLDLPAILAQTETQEKVANILDVIFREVMSAGNVILVIDGFHNFVGNESRMGTINISGALSPYLPFSAFQIVAVTTFEGLHKHIEQNSSILSLFEKVEVQEISERETLILLEDLALKLEYKYKKFVSYPALRDIISYCSKYLSGTPFPEKAMDLLDEAMVLLVQTKDKVLLPKHIAKIVSEKTQIPVGEIETKEKEILLNLENLIHQRIINQEEAVKEVSAALRRARAEVTVRKGPMGCFLFLGPTGVGKTETSKALAEIYFGSEDRMIRLDMSEFQTVGDIPRLIGFEREPGFLTTQVREKPFSLILLDEIEKAHPNILNLFLQVLDEGHLTDGQGRKVDFKNTIIIATSNAGYQVILQALKEKTEWSQIKEKLLDYLFKEGTFRPEFINRFDAFVVFKPLSKENLLDIAQLLLQKLKKNLGQKGIEFIINEPLKEKIVGLGYNPAFGAREMKRVMQDKIENVLASAILSGELKRGCVVEIDPEEFKLKINS